jgi:hypothetical protein
MPQLAALTPEKPAIDPLGELRAEQAELQSQANELSATVARLMALETEEAAALAAIGEVGRREVAVLVEWASAGGAGDAPAPLSAERAEAAKRLAGARQKIEAGLLARAEIEARQAEVGAALAEIDRKIDAAILEALERDYHAARLAFGRGLAAARNLAADVFGTRAVILGQAENLRNRGQTEEANVIFRRVEALDRAGIDLDASPLVGEVNSAREAATARAASLRMKGIQS